MQLNVMHDQQSLAKHFKFTAMKIMLFGISPRVNYDKNLSLYRNLNPNLNHGPVDSDTTNEDVRDNLKKN